jgi:hypothetical protein
MKNIDNKKLQNHIDENLKLLFKPYVDSCIESFSNSKYYHFLDEDSYSFLDNYLEDVDSLSWESIDALKDKLGQYIYISHWGGPFTKEDLIQLKENGGFDDNHFQLHDLKSLIDLTRWRSDEIEGYEPIRHDDVVELVIIKSYLEVYNS